MRGDNDLNDIKDTREGYNTRMDTGRAYNSYTPLMTHRIHIKLQLTGKSSLLFNSISSSAIGRYGVVRDFRAVIEA